MMGRRVLPLLLGLCAASALAQTPATLMATASLPLDGGASVARAYVVTGGNTVAGSAEYAMTNAGGELQVFALADNTEQTPLPGIYATFAVADYVTVGAGMTTLVVAADVGPSCPTVCLDIFFWDPVGGFVSKGTAPTNVTGPTAMTIDASSSPIRIFFTVQGTNSLVEQDVSISALGAVSLVGVPTSVTSPSVNAIYGLTVDPLTAVLFASDIGSNVYQVPEDGGVNVLYATALASGYSQVRGLFLYPYPLLPPASAGTPYLLAGSGFGQQGIYALSPNGPALTNITIGNAIVLTADAGRDTLPSGVSVNSFAGLTLVTEDATNGGPPWLHVVSSFTVFPDGGPADAGTPPGDGGVVDAGVDAGTDAGTLPTIPVIGPGPGVGPGPTNSCNCSTAGSAPMLLVLLLPLLVPRRRR